MAFDTLIVYPLLIAFLWGKGEETRPHEEKCMYSINRDFAFPFFTIETQFLQLIHRERNPVLTWVNGKMYNNFNRAQTSSNN